MMYNGCRKQWAQAEFVHPPPGAVRTHTWPRSVNIALFTRPTCRSSSDHHRHQTADEIITVHRVTESMLSVEDTVTKLC